MTSINAGLNPYAQLGSAFARAAATQSSLADVLSAVDSGNQPDTNAATNLTLSAARAQLASAATLKDFTTVTSDARSALDGLYTAANVKGPQRRRRDDNRSVVVRSPLAVRDRDQQRREIQSRRTESRQHRACQSLQ
jgi:hypothetical protein